MTIVIFGIINLAPGNPGQATNASGSERADQNANSREGFRLFKEHYNLDKPILLNFRYRLQRADVEHHLHVIASNMATPIAGEREALAVGATAASVISNIANADVKGLIDSAKLTFDYVLPIGLAIMGTFLAVTLGTKAWKRFAK